MTPQDKAAAYDRIVALIGTEDAVQQTKIMKCVGTLTTKQGIKGFKPVEVGEFVFELGDRYILVMETLDGKSSAEVPYYKDALKPHIKFETI